MSAANFGSGGMSAEKRAEIKSGVEAVGHFKKLDAKAKVTEKGHTYNEVAVNPADPNAKESPLVKMRSISRSSFSSDNTTGHSEVGDAPLHSNPSHEKRKEEIDEVAVSTLHTKKVNKDAVSAEPPLKEKLQKFQTTTSQVTITTMKEDQGKYLGELINYAQGKTKDKAQIEHLNVLNNLDFKNMSNPDRISVQQDMFKTMDNILKDDSDYKKGKAIALKASGVISQSEALVSYKPPKK